MLQAGVSRRSLGIGMIIQGQRLMEEIYGEGIAGRIFEGLTSSVPPSESGDGAGELSKAEDVVSWGASRFNRAQRGAEGLVPVVEDTPTIMLDIRCAR